MEIQLFGKTIFKTKKTDEPQAIKQVEQPAAFSADGVAYSGGAGWANQVFAIPFDGEKDLGEMGNIRKYVIDHTRLRLRSWQLYLESDVCQALFKRSSIWGIGSGLKLESEPVTGLLESEKIKIEEDDFNSKVEARFKVFAGSTICDYEGKRNLHEMMNELWINKDVGGDCLIVLRLVDGIPKVKIIDGGNVMTPLGFGSNNGIDVINPQTKNIIRYGIEIDDKGKHIAYWVRKYGLAVNYADFERIPARMDKYPYSEIARLVYGSKYRLENVRGIPLITAVMETASKMARYREAMLGSAEERAKIAYTIEHDRFSTGDNPVLSQMAQASGLNIITDLPTDSKGQALANKVAATVNKQVYNMPLGAKAIMHESKQESGFRDFYTINFEILCAVAGYPPEVILSKYDSNYSASRAAIKDFEHTLMVKRENFAAQTYQMIYNFCLDVWVLSDKIDAPGYMECLYNQNEMALAAYRNAQWIGDTVPHIDPYKEIQAIRTMLGKDSENFPLGTMEDAVQMLGKGGDYTAILNQYMKERDKGVEMGIDLVLGKGSSVEEEKPTGTPKPAPNGNPAKQKK